MGHVCVLCIPNACVMLLLSVCGVANIPGDEGYADEGPNAYAHLELNPEAVYETVRHAL